jgi:CspA family cold shock protein
METGVIKKLLNGFGFISREGSDDLFFHSADLVDVQFDELQEGDELQFEVGSGPKGPKADKVSRAGSGE